MTDFATSVFNRLASVDDVRVAYIDAHAALMAALAACKVMREETESYPGWSNADEVEKAIADALGIERNR